MVFARRITTATVIIGFVLAGATARGQGQSLRRQDWEGTLKPAPGVELRLVFHVKEQPGGTLTATMDSPDQGASDIAVDSVLRNKMTLTFELKAIGGKYEGKLNASGTEADGTWTQGPNAFPLKLAMKDATAPQPKPVGNEKVWEGRLSVGAGLQLRLVFHVSKREDGTFTATMDSPDQGVKGVKVDSVSIDKKKLVFRVKGDTVGYEGKLDASETEAVGEWAQSGAKVPLTLKLTDKASTLRRPQTPKAPYAYDSQEVTYPNKAGKVTLAATLTIPKGKGPFPAVIMISGSGAQDRDETLFEHKPFLVIADALTKRGVAVLRVDDRGVGGSSGSVSESTTDDNAGDVAAGIEYLKSRREINPKRIGLIGHSEGGIIAPMVASRTGDVAFIVLMAGTGLPGDQIVMLQGQLILKKMGASEKALEFQLATQKKMFEIVRTETDKTKRHDKLMSVVKKSIAELPEDQRKAAASQEHAVEAQVKALESPWFRYFLTYDPRPSLAKVRCPVLAIVGEKDLQVPPKENLSEIEAALKKGGNRKVTIKELPGLNHLFQTSKTGAPAEYSQIEETIAPSALKVIGDWVIDHTAGR